MGMNMIMQYQSLRNHETTLVHSKYTCNDVEHKSETHVDIPINYPIEYVQIHTA